MFHKIKSFRYKLLIIYFLSVTLPLLIIMAMVIGYFSTAMETRMYKSAESTSAAISRNIGIYLENLENITLIPYVNDDVMDALKTKKNNESKKVNTEDIYRANYTLHSDLRLYFQLMKRDVSDLIILPADGSAYLVSDEAAKYLTEYNYQEQGWYQRALEEDGKVFFSGTHLQGYIAGHRGKNVISAVRVIRNAENRERLAVVMADMDINKLIDTLTSVPFSKGSYCVVQNGEGEVICSNTALPDELETQILKGTFEKETGKQYVMTSSNITDTDWKILLMIPKWEAVREYKWLIIPVLVFLMIFLVIGGLLFNYFMSAIIRPLQQLSRDMRKVEDGDFTVHYQGTGDDEDEIVILGRNFNHMIDTVNELIDREYKAVIAEKNAQLKALRAQLQPHFLYNVLNAFIGLNRAGQNVILEKSILSLTEILRYSCCKTELAPLYEELDIIEKYCELQKLRFNNRLEFCITCEEKFQGYNIPRFLFQPLIENAILHGIEPTGRKGTVSLIGEEWEEDDILYLKVTIADDGCGFEVPVSQMNMNIGIHNVKDRLRLFYTKSKIEIESQKGEGTVVTIMIPEQELESTGDKGNKG